MTRASKTKISSYAPSQHFLVPKHEVLSKKNAAEVFKNFNTRPELFPNILFTDPVVKELDAKPGDLLKITRKSGTSGESIYYRIVVE